MKKLFVLLALFIFLISCTEAENPTPIVNVIVPTSDVSVIGDIIYVSTFGDNSNDGTKNKPFKTIQKAVDSVSKDKKTIYVACGIYDGRVILEETSDSIPIVIEGGYNDTFTGRNKNYQTVIGRKTEPAVDIAIAGRINVAKDRKLTVRNLTVNGVFNGNMSCGIYSTGILIVDNCKIVGLYNDTMDDTFGPLSDDEACGIYSNNDKIDEYYSSLEIIGSDTIICGAIGPAVSVNSLCYGILVKNNYTNIKDGIVYGLYLLTEQTGMATGIKFDSSGTNNYISNTKVIGSYSSNIFNSTYGIDNHSNLRISNCEVYGILDSSCDITSYKSYGIHNYKYHNTETYNYEIGIMAIESSQIYGARNSTWNSSTDIQGINNQDAIIYRVGSGILKNNYEDNSNDWNSFAWSN